nr:uncharacterized protein LOC688570 [Rattus norvegicus]
MANQRGQWFMQKSECVPAAAVTHVVEVLSLTAASRWRCPMVQQMWQIQPQLGSTGWQRHGTLSSPSLLTTACMSVQPKLSNHGLGVSRRCGGSWRVLWWKLTALSLPTKAPCHQATEGSRGTWSLNPSTNSSTKLAQAPSLLAWLKENRSPFCCCCTGGSRPYEAQGHSAKGENVYEFHLEFLDLVKPEPAYRLTQRQVNITVQKKGSHWWERLTKQEKRPLFLAPDFDRWLDESDAEMELRAKEEERLNKLRLESEGSPETLTNLKKGYLFMYNLVQLLGFSWIFVNITVRFFILGKDPAGG